MALETASNMYKILAVVGLVCAAGVVAVAGQSGAAEKKDTGNISVKVVTRDELKRLLLTFPNSVPLQRSEQRKTLDVAGVSKDVIIYTLGQRMRGDQRVAYKQHSNNWSEPNDVQLELDYPDVGIGSLISFVQVLVEQSNPQGQAYVIRGGIGQRYLTLVLEAVNTNRFSYEASIFGQD